MVDSGAMSPLTPKRLPHQTLSKTLMKIYQENGRGIIMLQTRDNNYAP